MPLRSNLAAENEKEGRDGKTVSGSKNEQNP
jgi:hypothetical protein